MNQYYMLIKNRFIDFDKLIIEKYHLLGLNETDCIILIKLNNLLNNGKKKLIACEIAPSMSISSNTISKRIVDLVKNGFITLSLSDIDASEVFSLDETYKRLSNILEGDDEQVSKDTNKSITKEIVGLIEREFKKVISSMDLEVINHWVIEDKYPYDKIQDAVYECVKIKKMNINYVDAILSKKDQVKSPVIKSNLAELFNNVYKKN